MPPGRLTLGPFALTVPIARGAMGEVWRAMHVARELPVAVKLLTAERRRDAAFARVFRTEVERMARLDHPNIVMVLDHGQVPEGTAEASEGRLAAGSPWLAMEYAASGSLAQAGPATDWPVVSARLRALLGAAGRALPRPRPRHPAP
jgi:eukaryotic-like serine/threonine-protein kinase